MREFARLPEHVIVFSYCSHAEEAECLIEELGRPEHVRAVQLNLHDESSIQAAIGKALDWQPYFDIVIHNAAATADSAFYFMEHSAWQSVIQLSLNSFFHLNKAFIPGMIQKRWGRIIVLASISGEAGQRGQTNYSAAKGALIAASKSLAKELARKGILVNAVSPGLIDTDMTAELDLPELLQMIPCGRKGRPEEVAKAVLFLASEDSSYITGSVLQVNGGLYT